MQGRQKILFTSGLSVLHSRTHFLSLKGGLDSISFSTARCVPPPELHYTLAEITLLLPLLAVSFSLDDDCAALFYNAALAVLPRMFPHFSLSETFLIRAHKLKNWRADGPTTVSWRERLS